LVTTSNPQYGENITEDDLPSNIFRVYLDEIESSIAALDIMLNSLTTPNAATSDFENITSIINTTFKFVAKFNTTLGKPYFPIGDEPSDNWVDADGLNPLTPV